MESKAVFLDKDGTLVKDLAYNVDPNLVSWIDGALECLRALQDCGYQLLMVSNQSGVARGYFKETDLEPLEAHLRQTLASEGIFLSGFYYCPHLPNAEVSEYAVDCFCRKPRPGMLYQAAGEHGIDLYSSWLVGDILNDVEAGHRAGCRSILLNNNHETEWKLDDLRRPDFVVSNLGAVAETIMRTDQT